MVGRGAQIRRDPGVGIGSAGSALAAQNQPTATYIFQKSIAIRYFAQPRTHPFDQAVDCVFRHTAACARPDRRHHLRARADVVRMREEELQQAKLGWRDLRTKALSIDPYVLCVLVKPESQRWRLRARARRIAVHEEQPADTPELNTVAIVQPPRAAGQALAVNRCTVMAIEVFQHIRALGVPNAGMPA